MAEAEPWRPLPFDEAIDISAGEARKRRLRRQLHAWYAFVITLVIAAINIAGFPYVLQWRASLRTAQTADAAAQHVEGWPYPQARKHSLRRNDITGRLPLLIRPFLERPKTRSPVRRAARMPPARIRWPPKIVSISRCWIPATA